MTTPSFPDALARIGFNAHVARACAATGIAHDRLARVVEVQRDRCLVHTGAHCLPAVPLPALAAHGTLTVGDWVGLTEPPPAQLWIAARLPPWSRIERIDPAGHRQPLVTNVDLTLLVMGLDADFNPRRLERYVTLARGSGVEPIVVLTKSDLCAALEERLAALAGRLPDGIELRAVDTRDPAQVAPLAARLTAGRTGVLLGSSGAGKSTLTNTLVGNDGQSTAPVRQGDGRGRHTTTARQLRLLPPGGCLIDTPGLRGLRLDIDAAALDRGFDDIAALATQCRFRDCRHEHEPGCAVRERVIADRVANYRKLAREIARDSSTCRERREQKSTLRAQHRALRSMRRLRGR